MLEVLAGEVESKPFDSIAYNREAMRQFFAGVGLTASSDLRDPAL
jgi:hypothetical protein